MREERRAPWIVALSLVLVLLIAGCVFLSVRYCNRTEGGKLLGFGKAPSLSEVDDIELITKPDQKVALGETQTPIPEDITENEDAVVSVAQVEFKENVDTVESVKAFFSAWAFSGGDKMYSSSVSNVLVVIGGSDNFNNDIIALVSISKASKSIMISPFFRDSYVCVKSGGKNVYTTLNTIYSKYGIDALRAAVSDNFKIKIDKYASFTFKTLKETVDAMGGVTTDDGKLNSGDISNYIGSGAQNDALRLKRHGRLMAGVIKGVQSKTINELKSLGSCVKKGLNTNLTTSELSEFGARAIAEGWKYYSVSRNISYLLTNCIKVSGFETSFGAADVYIVDYVLSARALQKEIYGSTNIKVSSSHKSVTILFA